MAQKVSLKVEFDDAQAKAGMNSLLRQMKESGAEVSKAGAASAGGKGGSKDDLSFGGAFKGFIGTQIAQLIGQAGSTIVQAFDPQKTARQKTEAGLKGGAELGGTIAGAAIGTAIAGPVGTAVGAAVGNQIGKLASEIADVIDRKNKAVDESISQTLQQEAAMRVRLGVPLDRDELRRIGYAERRGAEAEYEARQQAISVTNEVSPGFLGINGLVRGRKSDMGGGAQYRDALAQYTDDRN